MVAVQKTFGEYEGKDFEQACCGGLRDRVNKWRRIPTLRGIRWSSQYDAANYYRTPFRGHGLKYSLRN